MHIYIIIAIMLGIATQEGNPTRTKPMGTEANSEKYTPI